MKNKKFLTLLALLAIAFLTASIPKRVTDKAGIFSPNTMALVNDKDMRYRGHKASPQVYLVSQHGLHLQKPKHIGKNDLYVLVGADGAKKNVRLYPGASLAKTLNRPRCDNLVVSQEKKLRSKKNDTFNKGLQKVIAASCTLIEQHFGYASDVHSLGKEQLREMTSPHAVNLPTALVIAAAATLLFLWYRNKKFDKK